MISAKKNIHRNFEDLMLFEVGPVFKGSKPGEQSTMIGAIKTGKYSRKNWIEKERNFDVFDIKNDALRTLNEVGIENSKIAVSNKTKKWYHPGRSGLLSLGSTNGPELAYFGEIHPSIIKRLDLRTDNVLGFEIFLDNIPESRKKIREAKPQFLISDYQKVVRDFAFVIDEKYSSGEIISLVKKIDKDKLIEMTHLNESIYGTGIASSYQSQKMKSGVWQNDDMLANVCKHNVTRFPYQISRFAQDIAGGLMVTLPSEAELRNPITGPLLEKYLKGRKGVDVESRMRILRLIENMTMGRNAVGYLTESMHGAGSPQAQRIQIARQMQLGYKKRLAKNLAKIQDDGEETLENADYFKRVFKLDNSKE